MSLPTCREHRHLELPRTLSDTEQAWHKGVYRNMILNNGESNGKIKWRLGLCRELWGTGFPKIRVPTLNGAYRGYVGLRV